MKPSTQIYATGVSAAGAAVFLIALSRWQMPDWALFWICLLGAVGLSALKIRVPGTAATVTGGFVMLLISSIKFGWQATVVIAGISGIAQTVLLAQKRPAPIQVAFNFGTLVLSALVAVSTTTYGLGTPAESNLLASLMLSSTLLFLANLFLVSRIVSLSTGDSWAQTVRRCNLASFPFYCLGAGAAYVTAATSDAIRGVMLCATILIMLSAVSFYREVLGTFVRERAK